MEYLGINNAEDYIYFLITKFEKHNKSRKLRKILTPPHIFEELRQLATHYTNYRVPMPDHVLYEDYYTKLQYNGVIIERSFSVTAVVLVPEGSLGETLYE